MTPLITDLVLSYWQAGRKVKKTPSGWISGNAPCCTHNGGSIDTRGRGGLFITAEYGCTWHCFNCNFKASWQPGRQLTAKFKKLLQWLGVPDDSITKCTFDALRLKDEQTTSPVQSLMPFFFDKAVPMGAKPISEWVKDPPPEALGPVVQYIYNRGYTVDDYNWYWTDEPGFTDRLIIPFYYQNRIVGYTARLVRSGKLKYISEQQPGYVFNLDNQTYDRKFVLVTEGPMDAICVDGTAVMSNEISPQQRHLISRLQREVVVVPDRDAAGYKMIEQALEFGWSVSMPEWDTDLKDINDVVNRYGKLYALWTIAKARQSMPLKIQLRMKTWIK